MKSSRRVPYIDLCEVVRVTAMENDFACAESSGSCLEKLNKVNCVRMLGKEFDISQALFRDGINPSLIPQGSKLTP
eukprot:252570-Amphidinium_carterae.2